MHPGSMAAKPVSNLQLELLQEKKTETHAIKIFTVLTKEQMGGQSHQPPPSHHKDHFENYDQHDSDDNWAGQENYYTGKSHARNPPASKHAREMDVLNGINFIHLFIRDQWCP